MTRALQLVGLAVVACCMNLVSVDHADARRLGAGRTLGGKPSFQRSARPRTPSQQAALNQNQRARQQFTQRGGMMGLLGGLAIGGLLGAMFFGGAFENLNLLDMLIFGGLAYLLFRMLAARQRPSRESRTSGPGGQPGPEGGPISTELAPDSPVAGEKSASGGRTANFDESAFLAGACRAFELLQKSWSDQDLAEIRGLTTDTLFAELQDQARQAQADPYVQVLNVDAELLDVRETEGHQEASVLFDGILRESESTRPKQVREIWHFMRPNGALAPTWYLDGIEQLES